jgi:HEAT repeat protein
LERTSWESRLSHRQVKTRLQAVQEIAGSKDPARMPLLLRALQDRSNFVVAAAARGLSTSPSQQAIEPLMQRFRWLDEKGKTRDATCAARIAIIPALVACEAAEAGDLYLRAIRTVQIEPSGMGVEDVAIPLRIEAATALATFRIPGTLLALAILLVDASPVARAAAATALEYLGDPGAVAVLGMRLARPGAEEPEVLVACMDALVNLDADAALQLVSPFLESTDPYLVAGAATALARRLGQSYHEKVLVLLEEACDRTAAQAREAVILAIASMRSDATAVSLSRLANHHEAAVRLATVMALEQRADAESERLLRELAARTTDRQVSRAAKEVLQRLAQS